MNDFKSIYSNFVDILVNVDPDLRLIVLGEDVNIDNGEITFKLGNQSFNYVYKPNPHLLDRIALAAALSDHIIAG